VKGGSNVVNINPKAFEVVNIVNLDLEGFEVVKGRNLHT
jgi:hypothetical protein